MESKHTPGPWYVTASASDGAMICSPDAAIAHWPADGGTVENCANARLIAAAPDLLAALVELHDYLRGCGEVRDTLEMLQRSHAAIAKATGGEK